jgi:hypothetical protein
MLCNECSKVFAFDQTDRISWMKKNAIERAQEHDLDDATIRNLRADYDRYQETLDLPNAKSQVPCPWAMTEPLDTVSLRSHTYHVWPSEKSRQWRELKHSAVSNRCDMCVVLVAMIENCTSSTVCDNTTISGLWFLQEEDMRLDYLQIKLSDGNLEFLLWLRLHAAVDTGETSKSGQFCNMK